MMTTRAPPSSPSPFQVVVTIGGPPSLTVDQLEDLLRAGMTVARFDTTAGYRTVEVLPDHSRDPRVAQKRTKFVRGVSPPRRRRLRRRAPRRHRPRRFRRGTDRARARRSRLRNHGRPPPSTTHERSSFSPPTPRETLSASIPSVAGETPADFEVVSVNPREVVPSMPGSVEMHETVRQSREPARPGRSSGRNAGDRFVVEKFAAPAGVDSSFRQVPAR